MKVYRDLVEDGVLVSKEIFDIAECTYTGKDMGERSITATIYFATPIDFQIGDYIKLPMQNLIRSTSGVNGSIASGSGEVEKFYIYTMPTMKKVARAMENGKAFEHTLTFYPAQYELSCVQMRDLGNSLNADSVVYTGFDNVTFNGAAHELMERIMMVLKEAYHDSEGNPLWSYEISDTVNEDVNLALERFPISFSGNTVMDALLELNNKETINTTFFINNRKIYVGFKRPYFCRVTDGMSIDTNPSSQLFTFQYGKTSDKGVALQYGGLYDITKTVGKEVPITKLFAYGASRNLNRYYCSDRVKGGRYVNRLMLPSFDADGKTDFIISEDALQRYGVREATKQFEEIYPSIRYATYGDIRQVKYCIKVKASGVKDENIDSPSYSVARIQCYKIVEGEIAGVNKLVEAAPPDDLAIYIHAMDKVVKVVLYGGATDAEAISKQRQHDTKVPTYTSGGSDYIPGACFIVHDRGFDEAGTVYENANRSAWFTSIDNLSGFTEKQKEEIKLNQINYTDTFWLTDLYIFQEYNQTYFSRDGYSAWSWARLNSKYTSLQGNIASDSVVVNEIVHVEPITISDTNMTADGIDKRQSTFDIYLRDLGFTINEQNDFGDMVFLQNGTVKVSILDGLLAGQEFEISGSINSTSPSCICAFNDDGTKNEAFFEEPDYTTDGTNPQTPHDAFNKGAIWRIRLNRTNVDEADYSNLNLAMPTKEINAKSGDHLVLLDLFMPDIYIHAAENRLLREARKYLEANDNGSISYAVNFDKVRMQQIPNYAMQLREGLNLRVVDEDLNIKTENNGRYIADYRDNKLYSQRTLDNGKNIDWISANAPIDFTRSKYYIVEFSIFNSSAFDINAFNFALFKSKNEESISFVPEFTVEQEVKGMEIILKVKFQLPDNFDDGQLYYPSIYLNQLKSWYDIIDMYLISVFERDFDENTNILNYADFTIDSLTVKITDNSGNNEPIREITATLSEQTNATAWATLMNRVATTAKEGEQNRKAIEEVVNTARRNYQALLSLKNSIFDPDGSCDQTFLQVMMQQVGADSMNYQLDNTRSGLSSDGQPVLFNCSCERGSDGYYHFKVYNDDTLRHYVYTQGSQAGNWEIPVGATGVDVKLNGTDSYFVCLKCPKNDTVGQWICSTKQYAVNDPKDDTCWFFNWAILTVDSGGVYTLMETRGNAYMYGDNLVCGKISSLARNSYFDLTSGDFVLGDGTGPALEYINGVLTIKGSQGDAEETLRQLGLLQKDVKNMEIGGTNLVQGTSSGYGWTGFDEYGVEDGIFYCKNINKGNDGAQIYSPKNIVLSANSDYTISFEMKASSDIRRVQFYFINYLNSSSYESIYNTEIANKDVSTEWKKYKFNFKPTKNITSGCLRFDNDGLAGSTGNTELWLRRIKLEKGTVATDWTPAPEDVDDAIAAVESKAEALGYLTEVLEDSKNTTDITGGLVMTNVLMLKDLANAGGSVGAGMSGISADNILMWGGGTYEDAVHAKDNDFEKLKGSDITTLLKKDGTGKIGIFKISDTQAVVDVPNQGKVIIDASTENGGIRLYDNYNAEKIVITPKSIKNHKSGTAVIEISDSLTVASTTVNGSSYTASSDGFSVVYDQNSIKISYNVSAYFYFRNIGTSYASATLEIKLQKSSNGTTWQDVQTIETTSGSRNIDFANESDPSIYLSLNNSKEINNVGWSNNYRVVASFRETTSNNHYIKINNGSASVSGECSDESYSKTIIFSDGLLTEKALQSFKVDNSGTAQKIFAKGLSNRKGTAGSGELYVSDSFLNNFKDFLDELNSIFEDVRFVGNNKEYALNIAAKISTLKASIDESAIIASS